MTHEADEPPWNPERGWADEDEPPKSKRKKKAANGEPPPELEERPFDDWMVLLMCNEHRAPKGNEYNVGVALRHCPAFAGKIGYDVRLQALVAIQETPAGKEGRWSDAHSAALCMWLQHVGIPCKVSTVEAAIAGTVRRVEVDPLRGWLDGLVWDGRTRIGTWLADYCGADEEDPTVGLIGSKFLIGAVARALRPGCRMDNMLVLEGDQGVGKSTLVKILGAQWAGENLPDFHSRDAMQVVGAKWFVEISELAPARKSDLEEIKAFITRTEDTYVPKYARYPITVKRWSVLIGNVNPDGVGYLKDTTGNRRFWPVRVGQIRTAELARDREQLIAESVACYRSGDPWWVENGEQASLLGRIQDDRTDDDAWETVIEEWFQDRLLGTCSTLDVATGPLKMERKEINRGVEIRIGYAMKRLGFFKKRVRNGNLLSWVFERPGG